MTPELPQLPNPSATDTSPARPVRNARGRRVAYFVVAVVLAGVAAGAWWWLRPMPPEPPMPAGLRDPEVLPVIEAARQKVLDAPRSAAAWGYLGKVMLGNLFTNEADFCFAEAARLAPREPLWLYGRALIALKREPEKGVPLLRGALEAGGVHAAERPDMQLQLAEELLERGELDEAEKLFREDQERAPGNARSAFGLGLLARARADNAAAAKFFSATRASPFCHKKAIVQLASLARARGETEAAAAYETQAADLPADPPWPDPLLDEVVELQVGRRGLERRVATLEARKDYAGAAELYLKLLEKSPTAETYLGAGRSLARLRDYEKALPLLREAVRLAPDGAQAHFALAVAVFARAERLADAAKDSADARQGFREAVTHARRATELRPDHAHAYLFLGLSLKHLGETAAAVEPLRKGIACTPADLELQLGLGEVLLELKRADEARPHLESARRLNPDEPRVRKALERLKPG